ncbi:hypothetical protein B0F90DRAFT_1813350 [Multifurca ochricompacta]|uniref:Uncharacterized protein n=1 Tax=Multifurca ochricompacta TaxID=376703 RepID=A0AAD4MEE8_9AGAM|nr:hypothetical protein B0F90DRAFT_1813350 [Multifurca ochricompacta]
MFFPPLDSTVVIDVPSNTRAGGVSLLFRARTGSASALEQLKQDGVKVQAWTNAPIDDDRAEGEWGAYNFEEALAATPVQLDTVSPFSFSLPPPTPIEDSIVDEPYTLFLTLKLRALPRYQIQADFLVTYRLLYPNGETKWLGYHGRDLRCVLKKTDPWLAPPASASQPSGIDSHIFSSVTMKESWGCWAIGPSRVKYYPKGSATDGNAAFLVFVPRRGPSTFALHQPIIIHGSNLKLDSSGAVTCRTSTPTRVYTAIMSEPELSFAIPDLGLHWFGIQGGYAFITSAVPEQPVSIHAVPLFNDTSATERQTMVSLDLASHGLLAENPRFVAYHPSSNKVLDSDNWGSHPLHLSVGPSGGSCIISPVYNLFTDKPLSIGKAAWGVAHATPYTLVDEPEEDEDPEVETSKLEYDSETEFLSQEIKSPPSRPRAVTAIALNPRRTIEFLIPLLWRTLGYLVRALIMRLFAIIGLPVSPLFLHLRPAHPKGELIEAPIQADVSKFKAGPTRFSELEYAASEKSEGPGDVVSDSTTEVASSVGGEKWLPSRVFDIPKGPFALLAHSDFTMDGDEKVRSPLPEVLLDGERMDLRITSLPHGWAVMQAKGDVSGGRVEVYDTTASPWNGSHL